MYSTLDDIISRKKPGILKSRSPVKPTLSASNVGDIRSRLTTTVNSSVRVDTTATISTTTALKTSIKNRLGNKAAAGQVKKHVKLLLASPGRSDSRGLTNSSQVASTNNSKPFGDARAKLNAKKKLGHVGTSKLGTLHKSDEAASLSDAREKIKRIRSQKATGTKTTICFISDPEENEEENRVRLINSVEKVVYNKTPKVVKKVINTATTSKPNQWSKTAANPDSSDSNDGEEDFKDRDSLSLIRRTFKNDTLQSQSTKLQPLPQRSNIRNAISSTSGVVRQKPYPTIRKPVAESKIITNLADRQRNMIEDDYRQILHVNKQKTVPNFARSKPRLQPSSRSRRESTDEPEYDYEEEMPSPVDLVDASDETGGTSDYEEDHVVKPASVRDHYESSDESGSQQFEEKSNTSDEMEIRTVQSTSQLRAAALASSSSRNRRPSAQAASPPSVSHSRSNQQIPRKQMSPPSQPVHSRFPPKPNARSQDHSELSRSKQLTASTSSSHRPSSADEGFKIKIFNLQSSVTKDDIYELFSDIGRVRSSKMLPNGVAEVVYVRLADAKKAVDAMHNRQLDGQPMSCLLIGSLSDESRPDRASSSRSRLPPTRREPSPKQRERTQPARSPDVHSKPLKLPATSSKGVSNRPQGIGSSGTVKLPQPMKSSVKPDLLTIHEALFKGAAPMQKPLFTVTLPKQNQPLEEGNQSD